MRERERERDGVANIGDVQTVNSIENASIPKVVKIGDLTPVQDFEAMISRRDSMKRVNKAIRDMKNVIFDLVENSYEGYTYQKALESLEPKQFNEFLRHLCKFCQEKQLSSFCEFLASKQIMLIIKTEAIGRKKVPQVVAELHEKFKWTINCLVIGEMSTGNEIVSVLLLNEEETNHGVLRRELWACGIHCSSIEVFYAITLPPKMYSCEILVYRLFVLELLKCLYHKSQTQQMWSSDYVFGINSPQHASDFRIFKQNLCKRLSNIFYVIHLNSSQIGQKASIRSSLENLPIISQTVMNANADYLASVVSDVDVDERQLGHCESFAIVIFNVLRCPDFARVLISAQSWRHR
ncbi:hypothetical protein HHK36_027224 [Tetracentron sinense]|uniref:Ku C-terminal domain-containing protein n=1 Tax=Tetracentron sinense TaxID=13715 RepID=A0A835D671_TETSI|nr:hypothetical protein HHK36_027224 [Tetracentron sinense]